MLDSKTSVFRENTVKRVRRDLLDCRDGQRFLLTQLLAARDALAVGESLPACTVQLLIDLTDPKSEVGSLCRHLLAARKSKSSAVAPDLRAALDRLITETETHVATVTTREAEAIALYRSLAELHRLQSMRRATQSDT